MKILLLITLVLSLLYSCSEEEKRYLWTKYDSEYAAAKTFAQKKCINESYFFSRFDVYEDFSSAPYSVGDIFKITQDDFSAIKIYVKIESIDATSMTLVFNGPSTELDKRIVFTEANHVSLGNFFKNAVCGKDNEDFIYSVSGLGSESALGFTWFKETIIKEDSTEDNDTVAEEYSRRFDTYKLDLNYPSLFYFYNAKKELKSILSDGDEEKSTVSNIEIEEVTESDECNIDAGDAYVTQCEFASVLNTCTLNIDEDAYLLRSHTTKEISLTGTNCNLIESTGGI